jgi:hypothetical protein
MRRCSLLIIMIFSGSVNAVDLRVNPALSDKLVYQCKIETSSYRGSDANSVFQSCFTSKGYSYDGFSVRRIPTKAEEKMLDRESERNSREISLAESKRKKCPSELLFKDIDPRKVPWNLKVNCNDTNQNLIQIGYVVLTDEQGFLLRGYESRLKSIEEDARISGIPNPAQYIKKR